MTATHLLLQSLPVRLLCVITGAMLVSWASRVASTQADMLRPSTTSRLAGAVVRCSVRVSQRTGLLQHPSDASTVPTRLAAAPRSWPARAVALGASGDTITSLSSTMPAVRLIASVTCAAAGAFSMPLVGPLAGTAFAAAAATIGARLPDLVLARSTRRAMRSGRSHSATAVDMVAAATSAGVPLHDALELAAAHSPPPVAAALRAAALSRLTGNDPKSALGAEAERFQLPVLAEIGDAVERQRRFGAPLAGELRRIAARLRAEQRAHALERAARRGPLATLVVALVIAPICLATLTACVVGGIVESGTLGLQ